MVITEVNSIQSAISLYCKRANIRGGFNFAMFAVDNFSAKLKPPRSFYNASVYSYLLLNVRSYTIIREIKTTAKGPIKKTANFLHREIKTFYSIKGSLQMTCCQSNVLCCLWPPLYQPSSLQSYLKHNYLLEVSIIVVFAMKYTCTVKLKKRYVFVEDMYMQIVWW